MTAPVLSPEEQAQLSADKVAKKAFIDTLTSQLSSKAVQIQKLTVSDSAFKKFMDYYNDDIIGKYETERKALDGKYIAIPFSESDVVGTAHVDGSFRTTPRLPQTDIVRIPEFDGGPYLQYPIHEQAHIENQALLEDRVVNGFTFTGSLGTEVYTTTALTSLSTTLNVSGESSYSININDEFIVLGGSSIAAVKVLAIENTTPPAGPPTVPPTPPGPSTYSLTISLIAPPIGTINAGSQITTFSGFNNSERTTKTSVSYQPLLNFFVLKLNAELNSRVTRLNEQLAALNSNLDPNTTQASAISLIGISKSFIQAYVVGMDIGNTGLASLANERSIRSGDISSRIIELEDLKAAHYDARYDLANNRANTSRGTLRVKLATESSLEATQNFIDGAQAQIDAINSLG